MDKKPDSIIVPIVHPIKIKNQEGGIHLVYQVEIGRMKVGHMPFLPLSFLQPLAEGEKRKIATDEFGPFLRAITNLKQEEADQIDLEDVPAIMDAVESFFQ